MSTQHYPLPSRSLYFSELSRMALEHSLLVLLQAWLRQAPRGDGHAVIAIPGFTANDWSTRALRRYLKHMNYAAHGWRQSSNWGFRLENLRRLQQQVEHLHSSTGQQVSLIGHSLGGLYAREVAKCVPDSVRQVISLGSPIQHGVDTHASRLYLRLNPPEETSAELTHSSPNLVGVHQPPDVPCTAILSKHDGIVPWQACVQTGGHPHTESWNIPGSHCGMGGNPAAQFLIAHQLARTTENMSPFNVPQGLHHLYTRLDSNLPYAS